MTIGEVAKRTGLRASAIRYYEQTGLLPRPARVGGQRRYAGAVLERLAVLERAKSCGFTLDEIRRLFNGEGLHSDRWRALASKKVAELDAAAERIAAMKRLLGKRCRCADLAECGRLILQSGCDDTQPARLSS
jgi:DNA-binding transcriptional MerR regulator